MASFVARSGSKTRVLLRLFSLLDGAEQASLGIVSKLNLIIEGIMLFIGIV